MTRDSFNNGMAALLNGFAYAVNKVTPESEDIYWDILKDTPSDIWDKGVRRALAECMFFPTIHELGVCCFGETKEHLEDRCDPLRFKQNYQVRVKAVSWRENMASVIAQREAKPALPGPVVRPRIAAFVSQDDSPVVIDGKDILERMWRLQDQAGLASFNSPQWYQDRLKIKPL